MRIKRAMRYWGLTLLGFCRAVAVVVSGLATMIAGAAVVGAGVSATSVLILGELNEVSASGVMVMAAVAAPLNEHRSVADGAEPRPVTFEAWVHSGPMGFELWSWRDLAWKGLEGVWLGGGVAGTVALLSGALEKRLAARRRRSAGKAKAAVRG